MCTVKEQLPGYQCLFEPVRRDGSLHAEAYYSSDDKFGGVRKNLSEGREVHILKPHFELHSPSNDRFAGVCGHCSGGQEIHILEDHFELHSPNNDRFADVCGHRSGVQEIHILEEHLQVHQQSSYQVTFDLQACPIEL